MYLQENIFESKGERLKTYELLLEPEDYDSVCVHGVRYEGEDLILDDQTPVRYSVFVHSLDGESEILADFDSNAEAVSYANDVVIRHNWEFNCK